MSEHRTAAEREAAMPVLRLRECLFYAPESGSFTWKLRPLSHFKSERYWRAWNSLHAGKPAGVPMVDGRIVINLDKGKWLAHRVAWAIQTGAWPALAIDHIDRDHANNSFANLRECTLQQNQFNRAANSTSRTGAKGVSLDRHTGRYMAKITLRGRTVNLGRFDTVEKASAAYMAAAAKHHGEFSTSAGAAA
ncbi:HNH endonuclease signature motif containing protein [Dyella sp. KRB-257]|uniref:HNH endonuclease signature motif containing protein n=1 Tax=Dyella sp. KRB-257 TaxID=3400915 RepID=UPI003C0378A1